MHVLVLPSFYPSAADPITGSFVREQALALASSGLHTGVVAPQLHRLRYLATAKQPDRGWHDDGPLTCLHASTIGLPGKMLEARAGQYATLAKQLCTTYMEKQGKPDILHAHNVFNAGLFAGNFGKTHGIATVVTLHSSGWLGSPTSAVIQHLQRTLNSVDHVIAVSQPLADAVAQVSGFAKQRIQVIGNLISPEHPGESPGESGGKRWLSVGSLTDNKGHMTLIRAFSRSFGDDEMSQLSIIGEGPMRPQLEAEIDRLGMGQRITLEGALSRKAVFEALTKADAFALATEFETFGLAILEALAAGVPVVTTRCGGPDSFVGEEDGRLVQPGQEDELSAALREVAKGTWDRAGIARRAQSRFGADAVVNQLRSLYSDLIATR